MSDQSPLLSRLSEALPLDGCAMTVPPLFLTAMPIIWSYVFDGSVKKKSTIPEIGFVVWFSPEAFIVGGAVAVTVLPFLVVNEVDIVPVVFP